MVSRVDKIIRGQVRVVSVRVGLVCALGPELPEVCTREQYRQLPWSAW